MQSARCGREGGGILDKMCTLALAAITPHTYPRIQPPGQKQRETANE